MSNEHVNKCYNTLIMIRKTSAVKKINAVVENYNE